MYNDVANGVVDDVIDNVIDDAVATIGESTCRTSDSVKPTCETARSVTSMPSVPNDLANMSRKNPTAD